MKLPRGEVGRGEGVSEASGGGTTPTLVAGARFIPTAEDIFVVAVSFISGSDQPHFLESRNFDSARLCDIAARSHNLSQIGPKSTTVSPTST